jgi:hypothetical protein
VLVLLVLLVLVLVRLSAVLQLPCCQLIAVLLAALLLSHLMLLARALQPFQLMLQHFPRIVPPAHPTLRCSEVLELRLLLLHAAAPDAVCRIAAVRRMCSWDVVEFLRRRLFYYQFNVIHKRGCWLLVCVCVRACVCLSL